MKFIIAPQELNYLINKCLNVVGNKPAIPILSNILIEAKNGELIVTATDLTVGVRCFTEAKITEEGATTLPAKKLAQLLRELTATNIEVKTNSHEVTEIIADSSRFKLHGMNRSEFPALPDLANSTQFTIAQSDLREMLFRTAFAISREDNRYVLTGVLMRIANGEATFAGTDGKRLARGFTKIDLDPSFIGNYVIPLKAVEELLKGLSEEGHATISLLPDRIAVDANNTRIVTKLLTGDYPDVSRIIPEQTAISLALHREELITLLRQISLFTADTTHSVRFALSKGELKLTANTIEVGEGKVSMPVNYQGASLEIAFNPNFFLDILRHSKEETIHLGLTDSFNPGVITDVVPADAAPSRIKSLLMPLRLNEA